MIPFAKSPGPYRPSGKRAGGGLKGEKGGKKGGEKKKRKKRNLLPDRYLNPSSRAGDAEEKCGEGRGTRKKRREEGKKKKGSSHLHHTPS